jgi:uncharacterized protein
MNKQNERFTIPARSGKAVRINKRQSLKIINTHGSQVVDTWAFNADDLTEYMSMEHLRAYLEHIFPHAGDVMVTNRRRPILTFIQDTSPGNHDTLMAACDDYRYKLLNCTEYHDNCTDNLYASMEELGLRPAECPSPLNLWMNIPVGEDGGTQWGTPMSKPGDYVVFRAEMDCIVAMSACPQDILPINGEMRTPTEAHYQLVE